jgi:hypothetical protein
MDEDVDLPGKQRRRKGKKKRKPRRRKNLKKERESPDFTIELVTTDGVTASALVSQFISIPPPFKEKFTETEILDDEGIRPGLGNDFSDRSRAAFRLSHC